MVTHGGRRKVVIGGGIEKLGHYGRKDGVKEGKYGLGSDKEEGQSKDGNKRKGSWEGAS